MIYRCLSVWFMAVFLAACGAQNDNPHNLIADKNLCRPQLFKPSLQRSLTQATTRLGSERMKSLHADLIDLRRLDRALQNIHTDIVVEYAEYHTDQDVKDPNIIECKSQWRLILDGHILSEAHRYAPFIYAANNYENRVNERMQQSAIERQHNTLTTSLLYAVDHASANPTFTANPATIDAMADVLITALLPYAVKDTISLNGHRLDRDQALIQLLYASGMDAGEDSTTDTTTLTNDTLTQSDPATALQPPGPAVSLEQLRTENQHLKARMRMLWIQLDDTVRRGLEEEQQAWDQAYEKDCRSSDDQGQNLLCENHLLQNRIDYLQGFSIN